MPADKPTELSRIKQKPELNSLSLCGSKIDIWIAWSESQMQL